MDLPYSFPYHTSLRRFHYCILRIFRTLPDSLPHLSLPHFLETAIRIHRFLRANMAVLDLKEGKFVLLYTMQTSGSRRISTESVQTIHC
jgi:hypothetical protein